MYKQNSEYKSIQKKLVAAVAMVLVACIMVVSSSYAWFTLSTAPEVKGITTSVGSNGNLEMALRDTEILLDKITAADNLSNNFPEANKYWGNLLDLNYNNVYGLSNITLAPSRLNVKVSATDSYVTETVKPVTGEEYVVTVPDPKEENITYKTTYKGYSITKVEKIADSTDVKITYAIPKYTYTVVGNDNSFLMTPEYGTDGRIKEIAANTTTGIFDPTSKTFKVDTTGVGVRALGVVSGLSAAEIALRDARILVYNTILSAKNSVQSSMAADGANLANMAIASVVDAKAKFTNTEYDQIVAAVNNLQKVADSIKLALDQAVIAVGVQQGITVAEIKIEGGKIVATGVKNGTDTAATVNWGDLMLDTNPLAKPHASLVEAYADYATLNGHLKGAIAQLPTKEAAPGEYSFEELKPAFSVLMDTSAVKIIANGNEYDFESANADRDAVISDILASKFNIDMEMGTGVYAEIAEFVGQITQPVTIEVDAGVLGMTGVSVPVTANLATTVIEPANGFHLVYANQWLGTLKAESDDDDPTAVKSLTDLYGYIIDYAFRTNAKGSSLMLQTAPKDRVSETYGAESATMGAGSFMEFTIGDDAGYSLDQMVDLMSAIRVVIMDGNGKILGVAALDVDSVDKVITADADTVISSTTLLKAGDTYVDPDSNKASKVVSVGTPTEVKDGETVTGYTYDTITIAVPNYELTDETTVTAELHLYEYSVAGDGGKLILNRKNGKIDAEDAALMTLVQNTATAVSTLVYLDGDLVDNGDVAISGNSMTGKMNLQFASSADLVPMNHHFQTEKLEKPTVSIEGNILTITKGSNAPDGVKYTISVAVGNASFELAKDVTVTTFDLSAVAGVDGVTAGETYTISVVETATGYTDSDAATATYQVPTPAPTD